MPISRLWEQLGATDDVFEVTAGSSVLSDADILSMTLTRGNGNPTGVTTSTATIQVAGARPAMSMDAVTADVRLTAYGALLLLSKIGAGPPDAAGTIARRWTGRAAGQTVTDTGDPREAQWQTKITCSDLFSIISAVGAGAKIGNPVPPRNGVFPLIQDMFDRSGVDLQVQALIDDRAGLLIDNPDPDKVYSVSTVQGHFITDCGYLLRIRRDGVGEILDTFYRQSQADDWRTTAPQPLTRAAAQSPVSWKQRVTMPYGIHWDQQNGYGWDVWIASNNPDVGKWPQETLNMKDVYPGNGWSSDNTSRQLLDAMNARVYRSARSGYVLDTVTVDVLDLMNRDAQADRDLCAQLLTAEPGDPLVLSNDWPSGVSGVFTITRITETITPKTWTLAVDVAPITWATGRLNGDHDGDTWDTAFPRDYWWISPADSTTWDSAPATP